MNVEERGSVRLLAMGILVIIEGTVELIAHNTTLS